MVWTSILIIPAFVVIDIQRMRCRIRPCQCGGQTWRLQAVTMCVLYLRRSFSQIPRYMLKEVRVSFDTLLPWPGVYGELDRKARVMLQLVATNDDRRMLITESGPSISRSIQSKRVQQLLILWSR